MDTAATEFTGLHLMGATLMSPSIRLTIPPARVRDVQQLLMLEAGGFLPKGRVQYDADHQAFLVELDGDAVSHLLDLLMIATEDRHAETWEERRAREGSQLSLRFADPVGDFIRSTQREIAGT